MVRAVTAYFAFSDVNRAEVRAELQAAAAPDEKVSVAAVAKALGEKWRGLDDAEKERYKKLAAERTKAAAESAAAAAAAAEAERATSPASGRDDHSQSSGKPHDAAAGAAPADGSGEAPTDPAKPAALPISVVKRIMFIDEDVSRASAGAVRTVATAAELWLARMAERAVAVKGKRKTLKFSDVQMVAAKDRRLGDMGLQDIYDNEKTFAEARGEGEHGDENGDPRPAKKAKREATPDAKARPITSFFSGAAAEEQPRGDVEVPTD